MFWKIFFLLLFLFTSNILASQNVKIAVLAFKSKADTLRDWSATETYFNTQIPDYTFQIIPMYYPELNNAVESGVVDFVITNSGHYVYLETKHHISRIATMTKYKQGQWLDKFGGVIFTRSDRADIKLISDIKGKKIATVDTESLGGYAMQMYELSLHGIRQKDVVFNFTGMPHTNVVEQVISGKADVGFVRTELLESMADEGTLDLKNIKVINSHNFNNFPFLVSTTLYPEWPIARIPNTSFLLANKVVIALLSLNNSQQPKQGDLRWTASLEYRAIHEMFQVLELPPYDNPKTFTLIDIYNKYQIYILIFIVFFLFGVMGVIREYSLRRKIERVFADLTISNKNLKYESIKNEMLLRLSGDGVHILNMNAEIVQVSDKFCNMLGYERVEMLGKHVKDWDVIVAKENIYGEMEKITEISSIFQTKHLRKDGSIYDAEVTLIKIKVIHEDFIYCSTRDITEYLISQSQAKLAALVYENSSDAIVITDAKLNIFSVNPAFEKLTDYTMHEVFNKSIKILQSGYNERVFYKNMWEILHVKGKWEGSIINRKKAGALFTQWLEILTVFDEQENPYRYIAKYSEITDEKEAQEKIWHQANFDTLTDLPNRNMFMFRLEKRVQELDAPEEKVALMYIDLDNFKEINDSMGHNYGDILLQETAHRIQQCIGSNDILSRIGGDDFTIIFPKLNNIETIQESANKILKELTQPFTINRKNIFISASIGITIAPEDGLTAIVLLKNAEQAMYIAKKEGKNRYKYFTLAMEEKILHKILLIDDMRKAILLNQFVLYYQPIMELATGEIHKAEALIRWKKENTQMISPADFIPLAEETGLIIEIGTWVISEACNRVKDWRGKYDKKFQISINKSPLQFKSEKNTSSVVIETMIALNLPMDAIVVEITEGLLMENTPIVANKFKMLEKQGISLSLDDFGTGYSSLSYLKKFDIDFLKIDQSFVRYLETDKNDRILCEAMVAMAHKLDMRVIAEGVETQFQKDYLTSIECDFVQGYFISRPIEAPLFEEQFFKSLNV